MHDSRPLLPLSSDPNDLGTLTPAHFLVNNMIRPLPEVDVRDVPFNRLGQYQVLQKFSQLFLASVAKRIFEAAELTVQDQPERLPVKRRRPRYRER